MCATTKLYKDLDWLDTNCVISQVCEASWGDLKKKTLKKSQKERGGGECVWTVKMLFKITIEPGFKNRNPLFPELETVAVCNVVIRCEC